MNNIPYNELRRLEFVGLQLYRHLLLILLSLVSLVILWSIMMMLTDPISTRCIG